MIPMHPPAELLEALRRDSRVHVRKLLADTSLDLTEAEVLCDGYGIEDPDEIPLLFWVIGQGISLEAIEMLMEHGLDLTWTNREGLGALDIAIKNRRRDIVDLCIRQGISLTTSPRRSGLTPLMLAASFGDVEMVDLLLANGASVDDTDKRGTSAIEYARVLGQTKMVEYLEKKRESQKEKQGV